MDNTHYAEAQGDRQPEAYISVDVETAGGTPSQYSLLSIGACFVDRPERGFYVELKPDYEAVDPEALAVSGLSMEKLAAEGLAPREAMAQFEGWLLAELPAGHRPVFVAFNAAFDWMFVNDYFLRYLGRNPFGYSALDIKAFYMGMSNVSWARTSMRWLAPIYLSGRSLTHNALADARDQAELFGRLLAERADRPTPIAEGSDFL